LLKKINAAILDSYEIWRDLMFILIRNGREIAFYVVHKKNANISSFFLFKKKAAQKY